jgi:YesN/AraC family two-component response regulator
MPDCDGVEIAMKIREHYDDKATIIILTAYNWDDIVYEAVKAGVDSFMSKPLFASNVLNEFEKFKGKQFDPQIADILLNLIHTGVIDLEKLYPPRPKDPDSEEKKEESREETKPEEKKEENKVETSDKADNKAEEKTEEKTEEKADEKEGK